MAMRPLFGSTWTEDQVKRFQEVKSDGAAIALFYDIVEAEHAFLTFKILNQMIPDEPPHQRPALIQIHKTAIEIVCRRLLGDRYPSGPPLLHKRETYVPEPMEEDRSALIDKVRYWFDHERKATKNHVNLDQLRSLEAALKAAQNDRATIKRARRSRRPRGSP